MSSKTLDREARLLSIGVTLLVVAACHQSPARPSVVSTPTGAGSAAVRLPGSDHGGSLLTAEMSGAQEAPGPGDPDGTGTAAITLNHGQGEICFELTVSNIDTATAAHIHEAPPGVPGPVVVPLTPPADGSSTGCVSVAQELVKEIMATPSDYYVNVHNAAFQPGAVRGQLSR
jgi:hypothetical protein